MEKNGSLPTEDAEKAINVVDGKLEYPSAAESGHVEIELPALPGAPTAVERLHARDFGVVVAGKIETAMTRNPYLRSGPQGSATQIFRHYVGAAEGAGLVDRRTLEHMKQLAEEFEADPDREEFFQQVLKPYLRSLQPGRRQR